MSKSYHEPPPCFLRGGNDPEREHAFLQFWDNAIYVYWPVTPAAWGAFLTEIHCLGCAFNSNWRRHFPPYFQRLTHIGTELKNTFFWDPRQKRYVIVGH